MSTGDSQADATLLVLASYAGAADHGWSDAVDVCKRSFAHVVYMTQPDDKLLQFSRNVTDKDAENWFAALDEALDDVYEREKGSSWKRDLYIMGQTTLPFYAMIPLKLMRRGGFRSVSFVFFPFKGGDPCVYQVHPSPACVDEESIKLQDQLLFVPSEERSSAEAHLFVDFSGRLGVKDVPGLPPNFLLFGIPDKQITVTPENLHVLVQYIQPHFRAHEQEIMAENIYLHFTGPAPLVLACGFMFSNTLYDPSAFHGVNVNSGGEYRYLMRGRVSRAGTDADSASKTLLPPPPSDISVSDHGAAEGATVCARGQPVPKRGRLDVKSLSLGPREGAFEDWLRSDLGPVTPHVYAGCYAEYDVYWSLDVHENSDNVRKIINTVFSRVAADADIDLTCETKFSSIVAYDDCFREARVAHISLAAHLKEGEKLAGFVIGDVFLAGLVAAFGPKTRWGGVGDMSLATFPFDVENVTCL
jgi:hypothetical protein